MQHLFASLLIAAVALFAPAAGLAEPPAAEPGSDEGRAAEPRYPLPLDESVWVGEEGFRCPGDDPGFWMDLEERGWVGYGETWDLHTCSQGVDIYAEGATSAWQDMRPRLANQPRVKPMLSDAEIRFYTTVMPYVAFSTLAAVFFLAWLAAFIGRLRRQKVVEVACAECGTKTPLTEQEHGVFCPSCGAAVPYADPGSAEQGAS